MTIFVCFTITFVHVYAHAFLQCCPPWRQHRILYVHISVHDVANACQSWNTYWQDVVMKNGSPDMLSLVYVTINTCRGENNEEHDNLLPHMMASKTTPKPHISQILICKTNMLSPITFSCSTGYQPKQRLQLSFLWNAMSTSFLYGIHALSHTKCNVHIISLRGPSVTHVSGDFHMRESGPPGTANTSFSYMELTCPPRVRLWGPWKTMFHVMSHKKKGMLSLFSSYFWLVNYNRF